MSVDLKLTEQHALQLTDGDLVLATESEEVAQATKIRLLFWLGEWILNVALGTDWLNGVFAVHTSQERRDRLIKRRILDTKHVQQLTKYEFGMDYVARGAAIDFRATTDFGEVDVEIRT
jgi:hypothetical protein